MFWVLRVLGFWGVEGSGLGVPGSNPEIPNPNKYLYQEQ